MFLPEIDSAPMGLRVPTPPPAGRLGLQSHSVEPYSKDLQGLDLSPEIPQEEEHHAEKVEMEKKLDRKIEAMKGREGLEHHGTTVAHTKLPQHHEGAARQSTRMPNIPTMAPQQMSSVEQIESGSSSSTVLLSSQAVLDQLLKLKLSPAVASSIAELQAAVRAEQVKQVPSDRQVHSNRSIEQSTVTTGVARPKEEPQKTAVDQTTKITDITNPSQTVSIKNVSRSISEVSRAERTPHTRLPYTVVTRRTVLEPGHESLVTRGRDAIPLGGTLQDSDHSIISSQPTSAALHSDNNSAAIIGEHILPNGWMRKRDANQYSVINATISQGTIRGETIGATSQASAVPSHSSISDPEVINQRKNYLLLRGAVEQPTVGRTSSVSSVEQSAQHKPSLGRAHGVSELLATKPHGSSALATKRSESKEYQTELNKQWAGAAEQLKEEKSAKDIAELMERIQRIEQSSTSMNQHMSSPITVTVSAQVPAQTLASAPAATPIASVSNPATKLRVRDVPYIPDNAAARQYSRHEQRTASPVSRTKVTGSLGVSAPATSSRSRDNIPTESSSRVAHTPALTQNTFQSNDMTTFGQTIAMPAAVTSPIHTTAKDRGPIRAFESDATTSNWESKPEVRITASPTRACAPATGAKDQVIGGSVGASMWSNTARSRGLGVSLGEPRQGLAEVAGNNFNRGRAPTRDARPARSSGAVLSTDPGIGDTSTLFKKYERPSGGYQVPAFIAASAAARKSC